MNKTKSGLMLWGLLLLISSYFGSAFADETKKIEALAIEESEVEATLDAYFKALADNNRILGEVALYKDGKNIYRTTVEPTGGESKVTDGAYKYKIGSITKTFTATVVFQLIEEGKLSLETKLSTFFPNVANSESISIEQMLNHHSGIRNYTATDEFLSYHSKPQTHADMLKRIEAFESDFEPGSKGEYSNSNYLLLGYIIEEIEGKSYGEVFEKKIIKPLKLSSTFVGGEIQPENGEAFSYQLADSWQPQPEWDMSVAYSAGALVSTTDDLQRFIAGLFNGELISKASLATMIALDDGYGKGIFTTKYKHDDRVIQGYWHNGRIEAFVSHLVYFPEEKISVVLLTNALNYDVGKIYESMLDAYYGKNVTIPDLGKTVELTTEQLKPLEGNYSSETHPLDISLSVVDGQLFAKATGQGAFPLTATSSNTFEFVRAGIEIRFDDSQAMFELKQGGAANIFKKVGTDNSESHIKVPLETLEKYVGTYQSDDFPMDIKIMIKGSELFAQGTGQPPFPLMAVAQDKFTFSLAEIVIEFDIEKRQLTITQRGQPRIMSKK